MGVPITTEEILIKLTENSVSAGSFEENTENSMGLSNTEMRDNDQIRSVNSRVEYAVTERKNYAHPQNLKSTEVNKDNCKNSETKNTTNTAGTTPANLAFNKNDSNTLNAKQSGRNLKTREQEARINSSPALLNAAQLKERNDRIRMIDIRMDRQCHGPNGSFDSDPTNVQYRMDRRQFGQFDNHETFFRFDDDFANHHPGDNGMPLLPTPPRHFTTMSEDRYGFSIPSCKVCRKVRHHESVCWHNPDNRCRCCGMRSHSEGVCWYRHEKCQSCGERERRENMCRY